MSKIEVVDTEELPKCPNCNVEINRVLKNVKGVWERHVIYMCPNCKVVLSIGNDTGWGS